MFGTLCVHVKEIDMEIVPETRFSTVTFALLTPDTRDALHV